jgi:hypothetical protein
MSAYRPFRARERGSPPAKVAKPARAGAPDEPGLATLATLAGGQRGSELFPLDAEGLPCGCCPACGRGAYHAQPDAGWQCSTCEPPQLPPAEALAGWGFIHVPDPAATPLPPKPPVFILRLGSIMEETCAEELAVVRLRARAR